MGTIEAKFEAHLLNGQLPFQPSLNINGSSAQVRATMTIDPALEMHRNFLSKLGHGSEMQTLGVPIQWYPRVPEAPARDLGKSVSIYAWPNWTCKLQHNCCHFSQHNSHIAGDVKLVLQFSTTHMKKNNSVPSSVPIWCCSFSMQSSWVGKHPLNTYNVMFISGWLAKGSGPSNIMRQGIGATMNESKHWAKHELLNHCWSNIKGNLCISMLLMIVLLLLLIIVVYYSIVMVVIIIVYLCEIHHNKPPQRLKFISTRICSSDVQPWGIGLFQPRVPHLQSPPLALATPRHRFCCSICLSNSSTCRSVPELG